MGNTKGKDIGEVSDEDIQGGGVRRGGEIRVMLCTRGAVRRRGKLGQG